MNKHASRYLIRSVVIVLIFAAASVSLAGEEKVFSHKQHAEEGAGCTDCHNAEGTDELPGLSREVCQDCHDEGAPNWRLPAVTRRLRIEFPHKAHSDSLECNDCHEKTAAESQPADESLLEQPDCSVCHQENDVKVSESKCAVCHGEDLRDIPPKDHKRSWLIRHGTESQWRVFDRHGKDCSLCHRSDVCLTCHKTRRPKSHTALWRTRTHGLSAAWDRGACKTCHNSGACIRCHRSTAPLNHKGVWKSTHGLAAQTRSNEHCAVCHSLSRCAACHVGVGQ